MGEDRASAIPSHQLTSTLFLCLCEETAPGYCHAALSSVGEWVQEQQAKVDKAKAMLQRVRERQWNKKNKHRVPATYQEGNLVLVHQSRLPALPLSTSDDPYFGPYKILSVDGHRITVRTPYLLIGLTETSICTDKGYREGWRVVSTYSECHLTAASQLNGAD